MDASGASRSRRASANRALATVNRSAAWVRWPWRARARAWSAACSPATAGPRAVHNAPSAGTAGSTTATTASPATHQTARGIPTTPAPPCEAAGDRSAVTTTAPATTRPASTARPGESTPRAASTPRDTNNPSVPSSTQRARRRPSREHASRSPRWSPAPPTRGRRRRSRDRPVTVRSAAGNAQASTTNAPPSSGDSVDAASRVATPSASPTNSPADVARRSRSGSPVTPRKTPATQTTTRAAASTTSGTVPVGTATTRTPSAMTGAQAAPPDGPAVAKVTDAEARNRKPTASTTSAPGAPVDGNRTPVATATTAATAATVPGKTRIHSDERECAPDRPPELDAPVGMLRVSPDWSTAHGVPTPAPRVPGHVAQRPRESARPRRSLTDRFSLG